MRYLSWVLKAELLLAFPFLLAVSNARNAGIYLILLCALAGLVMHRQAGCSDMPSFGRFVRQHWAIALAFAGILLAMLISDMFEWGWRMREYDGPFRLAVLPLLAWILLSLSPKQLRLSEWGFILGAFAGAIMLFNATHGGQIRPEVVGTAPIIVYSNLPLLLGFLAVISIEKNTRAEPLAITLKLAAGMAGVYASYLSQARGSWMAIPVLVIIAVAALPRRKRRIGVLVAVAFVVAVGVAASFSNTVKARMMAAETDTSAFQSGANMDTSLGIRFQLWRGSWIMFKEHPLTGIGPGDFKAGLRDLEQRQLITPKAATGFYHSHNDVLFNMATLGVFGLAAILALYLVPAAFFIRHLQHASADVRTTAWMGLSLVAGYVVCGLTDCFFWGFSYAFYSMVMAILIAQVVRVTWPDAVQRNASDAERVS